MGIFQLLGNQSQLTCEGTDIVIKTNRVFSIDQIAVMGDEELRRNLGRTRDAIRRAEDERNNDEAFWLQVDACYFLREREVRIARAEAHRRYIQTQMSNEVFPAIEA